MVRDAAPAAPSGAHPPSRRRHLAALLAPLVVGADVVTALAIGVANGCVLIAAVPLLALLQPRIAATIRAPAAAIVVASVVTTVSLALHAVLPALHDTLAARLPLLAVGALLLSHDDEVVGRGADVALRDAARLAGIGALAGLLFGALREGLGHGTLFAGAGALLGLHGFEAQLAPRGPWLLAGLPVGGLLLLGLLLALRPRQARGGDA